MPETQRPTRGAFHAVAASFLGWTLDAFDFFVVVFLYDTLAAQFHVSKALIISTVAWTLLMRPVGALIFGLLADRYGRRNLLIANVIFFSVIELFCGFSNTFGVFLFLRILYGIGMGGEWGVGASLAMEAIPVRWRGMLSGILQNGYAVGYLLASLAYRFAFPVWGWRPMFWLGGIPALLALYIRSSVPESEAWQKHRAPSTSAVLRIVGEQWKLCLYLVFLMTFMMFLSHGTQDMYPDFLRTEHGASIAAISTIIILGNIGAVVGGIIFGQLSNVAGRRLSIVLALILSMAVMPLLGLRRHADDFGAGFVPDAGGCAGRLGNHPGAPQRTFGRRDPWIGARLGVSIGDCAGFTDAAGGILVAGPRRLQMGARWIRDCDHGRPRRDDFAGQGAPRPQLPGGRGP